MFRAIIYNIEHGITILFPSSKGNWFSFNGRSYRKDRKAVCQVMNKGNQIKSTVEAIYIEGNPLPLRSHLDAKTVTLEHIHDKFSEAANLPAKSFLDMLLRR